MLWYTTSPRIAQLCDELDEPVNELLNELRDDDDATVREEVKEDEPLLLLAPLPVELDVM